jgi:CxxC-x17-CxxC domain-containing protein
VETAAGDRIGEVPGKRAGILQQTLGPVPRCRERGRAGLSRNCWAKLGSDKSTRMGSAGSSMTAGATILTCRDCGARFVLSDDERQSFARQGRSHPPSRCSACREARQKRQAESGTRGVAPGFRELRQTHTAIVCDACGAPAAVPFAPRPGRPVYCQLCFQRRVGQS